MSNPKFRVALKSPDWDDYPPDKWLVSTNSFTIGEFWEHEVELEFQDGGTLPFGDIDWVTDEVRYLPYTGFKDRDGKEIYRGDWLYAKTEAINGLIVKWHPPLGRWTIHGSRRSSGEQFWTALTKSKAQKLTIGEIRLSGRIDV